MDAEREAASGHATEEVISRLLLAGVALSALVVVAGGALYLVRHGGEAPRLAAFHGEPEELRSIRGVVRAASRLEARAIIQLGLGMLVATPIARVAYALHAFRRQGDRLYTAVAGIVLAVLLLGFVSAELAGR